jgi:predicted ATPase
MLKQIDIEGFRLCTNVRIGELGPIVALVGRNGAGKSNILQAVAQTAKTASSADAANPQEILTGAHPASVTLEFIADDSVLYRYKRTTQRKAAPQGTFSPIILEELSYKENDTWNFILRRNAGMIELESPKRSMQIGDMTASLPAITTLLSSADPVVQKINPARTFLSRIRYYSLDEPTAQSGEDLISHQEYAAWLASYKSSGNAGDSVLMRLVHWCISKDEDFAILESLLGAESLGLIDRIHFGTFPAEQESSSMSGSGDKYYWFRFAPGRGTPARPVWVPYAALSLGTRRVIRLFTSMLFDKSSVMLIEQPEDGLHQGMTKNVTGLLRANADAQLIMSSHSSVLLNGLQPEEIRIVFLHDGYTVVRPLTQVEREAALRFMSDTGPLYDFIKPHLEE